jgi:hypothetical protein
MRKCFQQSSFCIFLILLICSPVLFTSCATSIHFPVERPAEIDSKGATSIAIIPFSTGNMSRFYYNYSTDAKVIANYIQEEFQKRILRSGYFTLVSAQGLLKQSPTTTPAYDLYIHGNMYNFSNEIEKILLKSEDNKKKQYLYKRKVTLSVKYEVVYSKTNEILYSTTQHIEEESSEYVTPREVPSFFSLISSDLSGRINTIAKKLMPYTTTRHLSLLKYKTKDPEIKEAMDTAHKLTKQGLYPLAQSAFMTLYEQQGIFEAGYNAALLLEATGQLQKAEELMSKIFVATNNKKAEKALKEIQKEIRYAQRLQYQKQARKAAAEKTKTSEK